MQSLVLIIKGFIIGLGKVIPGVSGSLIAITLGLYDKCINSISTLFKDFKNNVLFLGKISVGLLLSIIFFSNIISFFLHKYYLYSNIFFLGMILGTFIIFYKKNVQTKRRNFVYFLLGILISILISKLQFDLNFNKNNFVYPIVLGFIDALTMIVPGISGTAIFMMLNSYDVVLKIFSNPFDNLKISIMFFIGLTFGIIMVSKIISLIIKKHQDKLYHLISGFMVYSIVFLFLNIKNLINISNIFWCLIFLILSIFICLKLDKL